MQRLILLITLTLLFISCNNQDLKNTGVIHEPRFQNGDIIFQTSTSSQSQAIQIATHSKYSHVGILFEGDGKWNVFEAIQPVSITPLAQWIARGENDHYVVKRLKDSNTLNQDDLSAMRAYSKTLLGLTYDSYFEWSNDKIYCSELVWKVYKEGAGIELCALSQFKDFDFSNPIVKAKIEERFGNDFPLEEMVVAPDDIFDSELLEDVD